MNDSIKLLIASGSAAAVGVAIQEANMAPYILWILSIVAGAATGYTVKSVLDSVLK